MRILVAEDDAISRTLLERTLQRAGYDVIAVEDGARALAELAKQDAPRLALLDWIMPEKDGVEVCREVRKRKEQAYTYLSCCRHANRNRTSSRAWNPARMIT